MRWNKEYKRAKENLIAQLDELNLLFPFYPEWGKIYVRIMNYYSPKPGYAHRNYYYYPSPPPTPHLTIVYSEEARAKIFRDQIELAYNTPFGIIVDEEIMKIPLDRWVKGFKYGPQDLEKLA